MSTLRDQLFNRPYYIVDNQLSGVQNWVGEVAGWLIPACLLPCLLVIILLLTILIRARQKAQP